MAMRVERNLAIVSCLVAQPCSKCPQRRGDRRRRSVAAACAQEIGALAVARIFYWPGQPAFATVSSARPLHHRGRRCDVSFSRLVFLFQAYLPAHTRQRRRNAQFKTVQGLLHVTRDFTLISGTILRFSSTDEFVYSDIV
ncbi:MAG TPA: hypothetical protein VEM36_03440 [Xanthobacteraceae bacterium]|nr:hypothetical protein [Xanthobacteraceae bacterium]